ncbi:MAG: hypothetical protein A7316_06200 [Candidatus Altiarchaeales archaeon WOR_SM1_86-2]|nr:MAG: hypothetical protein A7316_06200 [Candidatus Altiarchaeales archaeon WOR_SM1_86-2]ODS41639.1 MAG: hypothetical protein A7315_00980 [Candidatus Altiarchaeales archaeon WOR_SM1_79]
MGIIDRYREINRGLREKDIKLALCHRLPERSFFLFGRQSPVCARCTGIIIGMLLMPIFHFEIIRPTILLVLLFTIPIAIDGTTQALGKRESNNPMRFATGALFGMAQVASIVVIGKTLAYSYMVGHLVYLQTHIF